MINVTEKEHNSASMSLEGELTIYAADKFHQELSGYMEKYQRIDVDMSNVSELDTSCYQILLRAKLLSLKNRKELHIGIMSDEAQQVFDLYNLSTVFCMQESQPEKNSH